MSARSRMTMRAHLDRNTSLADAAEDLDGFGEKRIDRAFVGRVACWVWEVPVTVTDIAGLPARRTEVRMVVPLTTDIQEGDLVSLVTDRRGRELYRRLYVGPVARRRTHLETTLKGP